MKKVFAFLLSLTMISILVTPTLAFKIPEIKIDFRLSKSVFDEWFAEHPLPDINIPEPSKPETPAPAPVKLATPVITKATYTHKSTYAPTVKRLLKILWDAVENADSYEVLITKADGVTITYTADENLLYLTDVECPKVYVHETDSWTAATVCVRAVAGETVSEWSESVSIGCNAIH